MIFWSSIHLILEYPAMVNRTRISSGWGLIHIFSAQEKAINEMKVYIVYTSDYHHCDETIIKGFTDLEKAIELAVDVVMKNNHKYNRDYVKEIICDNYKEPLMYDLFVYTDYCDMNCDKFVGIMTVDVD